jgi:hypothetical protein
VEDPPADADRSRGVQPGADEEPASRLSGRSLGRSGCFAAQAQNERSPRDCEKHAVLDKGTLHHPAKLRF